MSDDKNPETEPESTESQAGADETGSDEATSEETVLEGMVPDEKTSEGEAHSRRRALIILVIVVVLAVVAGLIAWSVSSGSSPRAGATPGATESSVASDQPAEPEPGSTDAPAGEAPAEGEIADDIHAFDDEAPVGGDVTVALSKIESVEGEAQGPGEIGGPSIRFTVTFTNDSDAVYSLAGAVTNVYYGAEQIPAIPLQGPGGEAFPAEVKPGETATGTFVYNVPEAERGTVRITVDYAAAEPAVIFEGAGPK